MTDALSRYRQAEPRKDALARYRQEPQEDTLGALARYLGLDAYWDRQGRMAQDGLQMAEQGANSVRAGNFGGLGGALLGPVAYLSSPISALFPERSEVDAATDVPDWSKPFIMGGLETAAAFMPGPKTRGLGKGMARHPDFDRSVAAKPPEWWADNMGGVQPDAEGMITVYRGVPAHAGDTLRPFDFVATEKRTAKAYADNGGKIIETRIPADQLFPGDLGAAYDDFRWIPETHRWADAKVGIGLEPKTYGELARVDQANTAPLPSPLPVTRDSWGSSVTGEKSVPPKRGLGKGMAELADDVTDAERAALAGRLEAEATQTGTGAVPVSRDQALANMVEAPEGITAYHGSPHTFDKFDMSKIGTGEGNQSFGHGLYFAGAEDVAKTYKRARPLQVEGQTLGGGRQGLRDPETEWAEFIAAEKDPIKAARERLADADTPDEVEMWSRIASKFESGSYAPTQGSMYQVRLNVKPDELLDWDRPLSAQSATVDERLKTILKDRDRSPADWINSSPGAEQRLREAGIKGIRYKDAGSRGAEGGTYNYVIFDDKLVDILKRYGVAMTAGAGGAMIVSGQNMPPEVAAQIGPQT